MTWQLSLAAIAAQMLLPGPPYTPPPNSPATVEWDASRKNASYTLSNTNHDVENVGVNDLASCQAAVKPILPGQGRVYFEISVQALGAASNGHCIGLLADVASHMYNAFPISNKNPGCLYHHNGSIYIGDTEVTTGLADLAAGVVLGFVVDAGAGKVWIYRNNTLLGAGANLSTGVPTTYIRAGHAYYPVVNARDNADKFRIHSITSEFAYTPPAGTTPYGNDLVNFNYHYLNLVNGNFAVGNSSGGVFSLAGWSENPTGSTHSGTGVATASFRYVVRRKGLSSALSIGDYNPSFPLWITYPNQSGFLFGGLYQDHVLDSRFDPMVDAGEYALRMSAYLTMRPQISSPNYAQSNATFFAAFYDATDTLISSSESSFLASTRVQQAVRYIDVPVGTRKIRTEYRRYKPSTATSTADANDCFTICRQAVLVRKLPYLRAKGGFVHVILTP